MLRSSYASQPPVQVRLLPSSFLPLANNYRSTRAHALTYSRARIHTRTCDPLYVSPSFVSTLLCPPACPWLLRGYERLRATAMHPSSTTTTTTIVSPEHTSMPYLREIPLLALSYRDGPREKANLASPGSRRVVSELNAAVSPSTPRDSLSSFVYSPPVPSVQDGEEPSELARFSRHPDPRPELPPAVSKSPATVYRRRRGCEEPLRARRRHRRRHHSRVSQLSIDFPIPRDQRCSMRRYFEHKHRLAIRRRCLSS